jgi:hypothetical protein
MYTQCEIAHWALYFTAFFRGGMLEVLVSPDVLNDSRGSASSAEHERF